MAAGAAAQYAGVISPGTLLCPMIDARRMEVYTALFTPAGERVTPTTAEIIDESSFSSYLNDSKILFFGDGAEKCREILGTNPNAVISADFVNHAAHLSTAAFAKFAAKQFEDVAYFEPFYLKDFIAGKKAL